MITQTKYAFKNRVGDVVMLLDNMEHVERWYRKRADEFGPAMPNLTLVEQIITETVLELPNV